jgi:hypothetical protein
MLLISLIINILLLTIIFNQCFQKVDITQSFVLGGVTFFGLYVVISGVFFWIDVFSLEKTMITCMFIETAIFIFLKSFGYKIRIIFDKNKFIVPFAIALFVFPFTWNKFGFFGMGQDQGVYQTKAINLIYGNADRQQDFEEYEMLDSAEERSSFSYILKSRLVGLDRYDSRKPTLNKKSQKSEISGIYHGIPTFPALLSLWGATFGVSKMISIQTVFFLYAIFLTYFISENLSLNIYTRVLATLVFAISPVVIWVSKSSLTEMFLCNIILLYIYYMTNMEDERACWISWTPIAMFSFYHVSCFTLMPIFVLIYVWSIIFSEKYKPFLFSSIISIFLFATGFTMMAYVSPSYTFNNFYRPPISYLVPQKNSLLFFQMISAMVAFSYLIAYKLNITYDYSTIKFKSNYINFFFRITILTAIAIVCFHGINIAFGNSEPIRQSLQGYYYGEGIFAFKQLTLSAYAFSTGLVLLPIILIGTLFKTNRFYDSFPHAIVFVLFLYCVLFYSSILRKEIPHYYYYSRYIVPFIPIVTLTAGILLNKTSKYIVIMIMIAVCIAMLPPDRILIDKQDDTRLEWDNLEDIISLIHSDDIVIVDTDLISTLYLPIKTMTGALTFPKYTDIDEIISRFSKYNKNIYIVTKKSFPDLDYNKIKILIKNINIRSEDRVHKHPKFLPFPIDMMTNKSYITLLKVNKNKFFYDFGKDESFSFSGFYDLEKNFRWIKGGNAHIEMFLPKGDYSLSIVQGPGIPLQKLNIEYIQVKVKLNKKLISTFKIKDSKSSSSTTVFLPHNVVNEGKNLLTIQTGTWSPSSYGSKDSRQLGISINKIIVEQAYKGERLKELGLIRSNVEKAK